MPHPHRRAALPLLLSLITTAALAAPDPGAAEPRAQKRPPAASPRHAAEAVDDLTPGIKVLATLRDPDKTAVAVGDLIHVNLAVHNPTDRTLEGRFSHERAFYHAPRIEDADGNPVKVTPPTVVFLGVWALVPYRLAPGESKHVAAATLVFTQNPPPDPPHDNPHHHPLAHAGPGHYRITWFNATPLKLEIHPPADY